jgi:hypothetical protein
MVDQLKSAMRRQGNDIHRKYQDDIHPSTQFQSSILIAIFWTPVQDGIQGAIRCNQQSEIYPILSGEQDVVLMPA